MGERNHLCIELLRARKFDQLDQILQTAQQNFEKGSFSETQLTKLFGNFCSVDESLLPLLDDYLAKFPSSYASHLALGIYYVEYGWSKRGYDFAEKLNGEQIYGFMEFLGHANVHLTRSVELTKTPILSLVQLMIIAMGIGEQDQGDKRKFYQAALDCYPPCLGIRKQYLRTLRPQWGGSLVEMDAFTADPQHNILPKHLYLEFVASKYFIEFHYHLVIDKNIAKALWALLKGGCTKLLATIVSLFYSS